MFPHRCWIAFLIAFCATLAYGGVPVIYSSDLFHPPDDPDDHYDLATLFSLPELDVKGIIIDMSHVQENRKQPGVPALRQIFHMTGRTVPFATGLQHPLRSPEDPGTDQPAGEQGGVELILSVLREAKEKVSLLEVGSLLDIAAAYNREPGLMRAKVAGIYINSGNGPDGWQNEWNVRLDPNAYRCIMASGLPIQWYPCFGRDSFATLYQVDQAEALGKSPAPLRAYFTYALTHSSSEPISFLSGVYPAPTGPRNMWSTISLLDLAGRRIYRTDKGYEALPERPDATPVVVHRMRPVQLREFMQAPAQTTPVRAIYQGRNADRIGKKSLAADGEPDCLATVTGLPAGAAIRNATLTGPRDAVWLSYPNPNRWRVGTAWKGDGLEVSFSFWEFGPHRLHVELTDGKMATAEFYVSAPGCPRFEATLDAPRANIAVIQHDENYAEVMASVLWNLLDSFHGSRR